MAHAKKDDGSIQELIEERGQINQWIERLAAATDKPEAVRNKVRAGYDKRLAEIAKELSGARKEIEDTLKRYKATLAELVLQEQAAQEKLSEAEVRHSVGELDDAAWKKVSHDVTALLEKVQEKLKAAKDAVDRTGSALASLDPNATVAATKGAVPLAKPVTGDVSLQSKMSEFIADPDPIVPTLSGKMQAATPRASAGPIEKPVTLEPDLAPPPAPPAPTAGPPPSRPKAPPPEGFDELAFIKSVSEDEKEGPAAHRASGMARLSSSEPVIPDQKVIDAGGVPPAPKPAPRISQPAPKPAAPQRPSALTPAPVDPASKITKCKECGTMNPPTEWYCSKCGAELSAI